MKKMRTRFILMLIAVHLASSVFASILSWTLTPLFFADRGAVFAELFNATMSTSIALVFFAVLVIMSINELTQPIVKLSQATGRIAKGELEIELPQSQRGDEIGELERNFARMVAELRSHEAMQRDFIQNVSHEFKTPLTVISGYARMLEQGTAEEAECRRCIVEETHRLSAMVSNILMLSKLDNHSIGPLFCEFSLDEQLRQSVLLLEPKWSEKDIHLRLDLPSIRFWGSEELLSHVWSNLIDNAIKFSCYGGVIDIRASGEGGGVRVKISDSGIGMNAETLARAFDQFYQGDASRSALGNGLGLSLARRIVRLHKGTITAESTPGAGAAFTVFLPRGE